MTIERWNVIFSGRVQGVGFRYRTQLAAKHHPVVGWVGNLTNGTVKLVAEADSGDLHSFIREIESTMQGFIKDTRIEKSEASGEFSDFAIRRPPFS